jgi:hypothetical protein
MAAATVSRPAARRVANLMCFTMSSLSLFSEFYPQSGPDKKRENDPIP